MAEVQKTRAERLDAVIEALAPQSTQSLRETNKWANRHPNPGVRADPATGQPDENGEPARHSGSPYVIETLPDGRMRIIVTGDDGDSVSGVGKDVEEALTALEAKVAPKGEK
jgi:hypothetical protein